MIAPRFKADITIVAKAETALTLAAYEFALGGLGVAWLPRSLVTGRWRSRTRNACVARGEPADAGA